MLFASQTVGPNGGSQAKITKAILDQRKRNGEAIRHDAFAALARKSRRGEFADVEHMMNAASTGASLAEVEAAARMPACAEEDGGDDLSGSADRDDNGDDRGRYVRVPGDPAVWGAMDGFVGGKDDQMRPVAGVTVLPTPNKKKRVVSNRESGNPRSPHGVSGKGAKAATSDLLSYVCVFVVECFVIAPLLSFVRVCCPDVKMWYVRCCRCRSVQDYLGSKSTADLVKVEAAERRHAMEEKARAEELAWRKEEAQRRDELERSKLELMRDKQRQKAARERMTLVRELSSQGRTPAEIKEMLEYAAPSLSQSAPSSQE